MTKAQSIVDQVAADLLGRPVHIAERGIGSFLTIDFEERPEGAARSAWHLWVYMSEWRLEGTEGVIVGSGDLTENVDSRIGELEGAVLTRVGVDDDGAVFVFEDGRQLRVMTTARTGDDEWMLFTPGEDVLSVKPGGGWNLEPAKGQA